MEWRVWFDGEDGCGAGRVPVIVSLFPAKGVGFFHNRAHSLHVMISSLKVVTLVHGTHHIRELDWRYEVCGFQGQCISITFSFCFKM